MLDTVKQLDEPGAAEPLIVPSELLANARQRRRLLDAARKRAAREVAEAAQQAEATRLSAYQDGYLHGLGHAIADIAQWMLGEQGAAARLQGEVVQGMREAFEALMLEGDWPRQRLERWLTERPTSTDQPLQLLLPESCKHVAGDWRTRLAKHWHGPVSIDFQPQDRFVFRLGDQVLELDVPVAADLQAQAQASRVKGLRLEVGTLDAEALQSLKQWFDSMLAQMTPEGEQ